jgi:hypothetical protein
VNRLLTILLGQMLGKRVRVRYSDFIVLVHNAGKEGGAHRVEEILHAIKALDRDAIGAKIPQLSPDTWKFGAVLPEEMLEDMMLSEQYHVEEFISTIRAAPVVTLSGSGPVFESSIEDGEKE